MKNNLGDRMKENYENRAKTKLLRRTPVIIRLDGKAFHTFTKGFNKSFDEIFTKAMQQTMLTLYYVDKQSNVHIVDIGNINFFTTQVDL